VQKGIENLLVIRVLEKNNLKRQIQKDTFPCLFTWGFWVGIW
jgi:hypothetical protein